MHGSGVVLWRGALRERGYTLFAREGVVVVKVSSGAGWDGRRGRLETRRMG